MKPDYLSDDDKTKLLELARQALEKGLAGEDIPDLESDGLSQCLQELGELRGCIGSLDANTSLAEDVRSHAIAAALKDYRFPPVTAGELPEIQIEISCLTPPQPLEYKDAEDLLYLLRPMVDGVVISDGLRRATFLPQVWEKIPDPELFLSHLCQKMGGSPDMWRCQPLLAWVYQVEKFSE
jgi:uncharacterized protein